MNNKLLPIVLFCSMLYCVLFTPVPGFTQSLNQLKERSKNKKQLILRNGDEIEVFSLAANGAEKKANHRESRYWWYGGNEIHLTQGAAGGRLLEGKYSKFNGEKSLLERGDYRGGRRYGEWISWHTNGNIKKITNWRNGMQHGSFKEFDADGKVRREGNFKKGNLHGRVLEFDADGKPSRMKFRKGVEKKSKALKKREAVGSKAIPGLKTALKASGERLRLLKAKRQQNAAQRKERKQVRRVGDTTPRGQAVQ